MSCSIIYRIDKPTRFPEFDKVQRLYQRLFKKPVHNGIGMGGFLDDVIDWVMEIQKYYLETGDLLEHHYVPNLTSHNKMALTYEKEFINIAVSLWRLLPPATVSVLPIKTGSNTIYLLLDIDTAMADSIVNYVFPELTVNQFIRPSKKIPGTKQNIHPK